MISELTDTPWTRKHDTPDAAFIPRAPRIRYPKSLEELIEICAERAPVPGGPTELLKAAGSHWSISPAAVSGGAFIETHDPNDLIETHDPARVFQAMGRTLYDVVPGCLTKAFMDLLEAQAHPEEYLIHFESGKRIYQLYSELDLPDTDERSLAQVLRSKNPNSGYGGSWAFQTLGAAGGQTVVGAISTGTHGGDFLVPPIADSVMALHLVADGGKQLWIEPARTDFAGARLLLTDDDKLKALYGPLGDFEIMRDDDLFNAALVSVGRFGIIYSVVLRAVRQYLLREEVELMTWQNIKAQIADTKSPLYTAVPRMADVDDPDPPGALSPQRYLQINISQFPSNNFSENTCSVTRRWKVPLEVDAVGPDRPFGRAQRRGDPIGFSESLDAVEFTLAGRNYPYHPGPFEPDDPGKYGDTFSRFCADPNLLKGISEQLVKEIEGYVSTHTLETGGILTGVVAAGGPGFLLLIPGFIFLLPFLIEFFARLFSTDNPRLGGALDDLKDVLLKHADLDPVKLAAGVAIWQAIANRVFESQQQPHTMRALSYAIMDRADYHDRSCSVNADSLEVFFDVGDPLLISFVDALLEFEKGQEWGGKSFIGYISLRFTGRTRASLGMQQHAISCSVEVAGLKDAADTAEYMDRVMSFCLHEFRGILHWGQRNESTAQDIEDHFGGGPGSNLQRWRDALSKITDEGRLNRFRSEFTAQLGLEIK